MQDLFNMDLSTGMDSLDTQKSNSSSSNVYKPGLKLAKDPKFGYRSRIRFLPNLLKNPVDPKKMLGEFAIQKQTHYIDIDGYPNVKGIYDQQRHIEGGDGTCPLYTTFWKLKNSKSVMDNQQSDNIGYSTKWYSYVLILEDENQPDLVGKIMVYGFGKKIKDKLDLERTGQITGVPCNIFDLSAGKDFSLFIKKQGEFPDYSESTFAGLQTSVTINGKNVPTEDIDGKQSIVANFQTPVLDFLKDREFDLEDFAPKKWSDEQNEKVQTIVSIVTGNPIAAANNQIASSRNTASIDTSEIVTPVTTTDSGEGNVDPDDFFATI